MKEYIEPMVEVIELPENDVIATSSSPNTDGDTHLPTEGGFFPTGKSSARNGMPFD